jgi:hypothetical protein
MTEFGFREVVMHRNWSPFRANLTNTSHRLPAQLVNDKGRYHSLGCSPKRLLPRNLLPRASYVGKEGNFPLSTPMEGHPQDE